jgi:hypothetical protein
MNAAIPERRPATEEISGLIERVTFHNEDSGFCVLRVKARGQREETTVVGSLPSVTAGRPAKLRCPLQPPFYNAPCANPIQFLA